MKTSIINYHVVCTLFSFVDEEKYRQKQSRENERVWVRERKRSEQGMHHIGGTVGSMSFTLTHRATEKDTTRNKSCVMTCPPDRSVRLQGTWALHGHAFLITGFCRGLSSSHKAIS